MVCTYGTSREETEHRQPVSKLEVYLAWVGIFEIILHVVCIVVVCIPILIPAAIALTTIRDMEEYIDNNNGTVMFEGPTYKFSSFNDNYHDVEFDANGSRAAAGWMVFICCLGIIFHSLVMSIRIYYRLTGVKKYMIFYSCMVTILSVVIIMGVVAGAVANGIQIADTDALRDEICPPRFADEEFCQYVDILGNCQFACMIMPAVLIVAIYGFLIPFVISTGVLKRKHDNENFGRTGLRFISRPRWFASRPRWFASRPRRSTSQPAQSRGAPPRVEILPNTNTPTTNDPPLTLNGASPDPPVSQGPPSYESAAIEPPPYEVAVVIADTAE